MAYSRVRPLKVLVASINFAPDHAGIALYSTDFPVYLAENGDQVSVVTGFPYYPKWEKRREDRGRWFAMDSFKDVDVYRGYLYVPSRPTTVKRLWHELTFCAFAFWNFVRAGRHDVIVAFTPPFMLGMVGALFKWAWRCPLVINIQDLPLDAALSLGMIETGRLSRLIEKLEAWVYAQADLVATISPPMLEKLRSKGVPSSRLTLVPNWIDLNSDGSGPLKGTFISKFPEAKAKFTLAYAGNLGVKQGLDSLLHLAREVQSNGEARIFIIGDGADKQRLLRLAHQLGTKNVTFLPFMPSDEYQQMLHDVDVIFVAQRSHSGSNFFPSKLLGLMAAGKPLLVAADPNSELSRVIQEAGCGVVSPYGDIQALVANFQRLYHARAELRQIGRKGQQAVTKFGRNRVLGTWYAQISALYDSER